MTPADRIRKSIEQMLTVQHDCEAEAKIIRKIADDLIAQSNILRDTAQRHDRTLTALRAMLRDEEAKS
jgi:hypothetical protein